MRGRDAGRGRKDAIAPPRRSLQPCWTTAAHAKIALPLQSSRREVPILSGIPGRALTPTRRRSIARTVQTHGQGAAQVTGFDSGVSVPADKRWGHPYVSPTSTSFQHFRRPSAPPGWGFLGAPHRRHGNHRRARAGSQCRPAIALVGSETVDQVLAPCPAWTQSGCRPGVCSGT